jgi:hypothetical protein
MFYAGAIMNRRMKQGLVAALVVAGLGVAGAGCLSRPVEHADPNLKTNFTAVVENKVIDKVDILFDIDNSASMGDKQDYLKAAIPDLVNRLVNPNCVDPTTNKSAGSSAAGSCTSFPGTKPEFTAIHDLHLGILSSSLGPRGGDACNPQAPAPMPFQNVQAHNDDAAHLLNRSLTFTGSPPTAVTEGTVADANLPDPFLYYFPTAQNAGKKAGAGYQIQSATQLITDFGDLVGGTGVFGCGIESQLESWYRFLIQPDPYQSISTSGNKGSWSGVDKTIIQQRHDFLRPDSLVAIIVLSDENDSEIDVRSLGGLGYNWMAASFQPPRGTSSCANTPGAASCGSCAAAGNSGDANCKMGGYSALNDWGYDLNLRHVRMKAKYGVEPQFPIQRYVNGLTSTTVPDRNGEYPSGAGNYVGQNDCQNPLFAGQLPDGSGPDNTLCHAPPGPRTKDLVFYAHIGGVPYQLLHFTPGDAAASKLTPADWVKILGNDPLHYDYTGIDPHMIEDFRPRSGVGSPGSANTADPINGHDWITDTGMGHILQVDREYACIFPLADAQGNPKPRDCTLPQNQNFCDCPHMAGTVNSSQLPPICDTNNFTQQTGAKAYPTIRELTLAKLMGNQGIVSSICPQHVAEMGAGDPLYGYRPAVAVIIDRLKDALTNQCLPQKLAFDNSGSVPCLILLQVPNGAAGTGGTCLNPNCPGPTLVAPDPSVLTKFCQGLEDQYNQQVSNNGGMTTGLKDPANIPVCELRQLTMTTNAADFQGGTCAASMDDGWCYVTGAAAGKCPQAIVFTKNALPTGAISNLQCLEQSVSVLGSGGTAGTPVGTGSSSGGGGGG